MIERSVHKRKGKHRVIRWFAALLLTSFSLNANSNPSFQAFDIPDGLYQARFVEDRDDIAVIEFSGDYDSTLADGSVNAAARAVVAKEFYKHHPDNYDFLVVFSSFEFDTGDALAFHLGASNDVSGIGLDSYSNQELYGSDGELKGYIDMATLDQYETNPFSANQGSTNNNFNLALSTLAHESLHQWAAHTDIEDLQGRDDSHWNFFLDTSGSVEYGHDWHDNGDGTFTARSARQFFSPLDLYLMGMNEADQVPDMFVIKPDSDEYKKEDLPKPGITISGTRKNYSIEDFVNVHGPRLPTAENAQKVFRYAFIYLTKFGNEAPIIDIADIGGIRKAYAERFSIMTGGKGIARVYPAIQVPIETGNPETIEDTSGLSTDGLDMDLAVDWLQSQQLDDGSWLDKSASSIRDTAVVYSVLDKFGSEFSGSSKAKQWLNQQIPHNVDSISRMLPLLTPAADFSATLRSRQNPDGGWGLTGYFQSNALDTALAICALADNSTDSSIVLRGVNYLKNAQNTLGGWSALGEASSVTITAEVLQALHCVNRMSPETERAIDWLLTQWDMDKGYRLGTSSPHEVAQVLQTFVLYEALDRIDLDAVLRHLASQQYVSGSWQGSVYTTALVVNAIRASGLPNARVEEFDHLAENIRDGDFVELTARIANDSPQLVEQSTVRFYLGDPTSGGQEFASVSVPSIPPFASIGVSTYWHSFDYSGEQTIFVVADADQQILESVETDNTMSQTVLVNPAPEGVDLSVSRNEFLINRGSANTLPVDLAFMATARNIGNQNAEDVIAQLWRGNPQEGGALIDSKTISVTARSSIAVNFSDSLEIPGVVEYRLIVDANDKYAEVNENNNIVIAKTASDEGVDFEILASDIQINPNPAVLNDVVEIAVKVRNRGSITTPNSTITFAIQNANGVTEIQSQALVLESTEEQQITASWVTDLSGSNRIIVSVDPENLVAEIAEDNNEASVAFEVNRAIGVNLSLNYRDLTFNPNPGLEGFGATISTVLRNTGSEPIASVEVAFYDGNPDSGGQLIGTAVVTELGAVESKNVQIIWPRIPDDSSRFIYVVADPRQQISELDENDNVAFAKYEVKSLPDFDVSTSSIQVDPAFPRIGEPAEYTVAITNRGKQAIDDVLVNVYSGSSNSGILLISEHKTIPGSGDGFVEFIHSFTQQGQQAIFVEVDPDNVIEESNENNNTALRQFDIQDGNFYVSNRFISPDGNGVNDSVEYVFHLNEADLVTIVILDKYDEEVVNFSPADEAISNGSVIWDGHNEAGAIVADGPYAFAVKDGDGNYQGERTVILDTNRSALSEAIGTGFELNRNLTCRIGQIHRMDVNRYSEVFAQDTQDLIYSSDDQFVFFPTFLEPYYDEAGNLRTTNNEVLYPSGIYRALNDGTEVVQLVDDEQIDMQSIEEMVVSPDGKSISLLSVYYNWENWDDRKEVYDIWKIDVENGGAVKVTTFIFPFSSSKEISQLNYVDNNNVVYLYDDYSNDTRQLHRVAVSQGATPELITDLTVHFGSAYQKIEVEASGTQLLLSSESAFRNSEGFASLDLLDQSLRQYKVILVDVNAKSSKLIAESVTEHVWSPTGQTFALADNMDKAIHLVDVNGSKVQSIEFKEPQLEQFTPQEQVTLSAYFVSIGYDLSTGLIGRVADLSWNPDASEFAFAVEDYLASFINSNGCYRGELARNGELPIWQYVLNAIISPVHAELIGEEGHCINVPENVRAILSKYIPIDGVYVADIVDAKIIKVSVNSHLDGRGFFGPNGVPNIPPLEPLFSLSNNAYDFPVTESNFPYISWGGKHWEQTSSAPLRQIRWLQGARELLVTNGETDINDQQVLLNLDNPGDETQNIFTEQNLDVYPSNIYKRAIYPTNSGKFLSMYSDSELGACLTNNETRGYRQVQSLLNLTADLRVRKSPSQGGFLLEGTATDKHFDYYMLEYADIAMPDMWQSIAPASNVMVIDDLFTTWVPPFIGNFYVRLTAHDLAGNSRRDIQRVNNSERASIANVYVTPSFFSPNGDDIKDDISLHFKVLENVNLEVQIFNADDQLVRNISRSYDLIGSEQQIVWDGRDNNGFIVRDGVYKLLVQRYEYFVTVDNTPPLIEDETQYLFVPKPGDEENPCRFPPDEPITVSDDKLEECLVEINNVIKANFSDQWLIDEFRLEQKLDEEANWRLAEFEAEIDGPDSASITTKQSIGDLNKYQYRFVVIDQAGNKTISLVDESLKRDRAHILTAHGSNKVSFHGFGYRDHPGYGNKEDYLYRLPSVKDIIHFNIASSTRDKIQVVEVLYKEIGSEDAYISTGQNNFFEKNGIVSLEWNARQALPNTEDNYELRIRLTTSDNSVLLTEGVASPAISPFDHRAGFDIYSSGYNSVSGLSLTPAIELPVEEINRLTLTIQSIGQLVDRRFVDKTELFATSDDFFAGTAVLSNLPFTLIEGTIYRFEDPELQLATDCGYEYRVAANWEFNGGKVIASNSIEGSCDQLSPQIAPVLVEACNTEPTNLVDITLKLELANEMLKPILLQLGERQADGEINTIFLNENLPNAGEYKHQLDTSALAEGDYPLAAVLTYEDGSKLIENFSVPVVHSPPDLNITYPRTNDKVCAAQYEDQRVDSSYHPLSGVEMQGSILSKGPDACIQVAEPFLPGFDKRRVRSYDLDGLCVFGRFHSMSDKFPQITRLIDDERIALAPLVFDPKIQQLQSQGVLAVPYFAENGVHPISMQAFNWSGALQCQTINVEVDAEVEGVTIAMDGAVQVNPPSAGFPIAYPRFFSPNGDTKFDQITLGYSVDETVEVSIDIYSQDIDVERRTIMDFEKVATLASDQLVRAGQDQWTWDGTDNLDQVLPDGIYRIAIKSVDTCGLVHDSTFYVGIDNTPPELQITSPAEGDNLPLQIRVLGSVTDIHQPGYQLTVSDGSDSPLVIGTDSGNQDGQLGEWNSFGREGRWTLVLKASDVLGNTAQIERTIDLPPRQQLISSHTTTDYFVSPNADTRLDELIIRTSFDKDVQATFTILDQTETVVRSVVQNQGYSPGYATTRWDGKNDNGDIVADGIYLVQVVAQGFGVEQTESIAFEVDTTLAEIVADGLIEDYIELAGSTFIAGSIRDRNFEDYEISLLSPGDAEGDKLILQPLQIAYSNEEPFAILAELPASLLGEESEYEVTILARDKAGNHASMTPRMVVDLFPPRIEIEQPDEDSIYSISASPVTLFGKVEDRFLKNYQVIAARASDPDNSSLIYESGEATDNVIADWPLDGLEDGVYVLTIKASDRGGLSNEKTLRLVVDNSPPVAAINRPAKDSYVTNVAPILGAANDDHFEQYSLAIASGHVAEQANYSNLITSNAEVISGELFYWSELPADGKYTFNLEVLDQAGNQTTIFHPFIVDTAPPAMPELLSVAFDRDSEEVRIEWKANTEPDLAGYELYRNGTKVHADLLTELVYLDPSLPDGEYEYYVLAVDQAGLQSSPSNRLRTRVDLTPPAVTIAKPSSNQKVNLLVDVIGTAFSENDFKRYQLFAGLSADRLSLVRESSLPIRADRLAQWDTLAFADNDLYLLRLIGEDTSGNVAQDEVWVEIDNTPPEAPIALAVTVVNGNDAALEWQYTGSNDGLKGFLVYRNGRLVNSGESVIGDLRPYAISQTEFDDLELADGSYEYVVYAIDEVGNISLPSNIVSVDIDLGPPHAIISNIVDGQEFEDSLYLLAESVDNDIASVRLEYRSFLSDQWLELSLDYSLPYDYQWDTQTIDYGIYVLRAVAVDNGGKTDPNPEIKTVIKRDLKAPLMVQGLSITVDGDIGNLSWDATEDTDLAGYDIYYSSCESCSMDYYNKLNDQLLLDTSFQHTVTRTEKLYYYVVAVDDEGNESVGSERMSATYVDTLASVDRYITTDQSTPLGLSLSQWGSVPVQFDEVKLAYVDPPSTQTIELDQPVDSTEQLVTHSEIGIITFIPTLAHDSERFIASPAEEIAIAVTEQPSTPIGVQAQYVSGDNEVSLQWTPNPAAEKVMGYKVFRNGTALNEFKLINDATANANSGFGIEYILPASFYDDYWSTEEVEDVRFSQSWAEPRLVKQIELDWNEYYYQAVDLDVYALIDGEYFKIQDEVNDFTDDNPYSAERVITLDTPVPTTSIQIRVKQWYANYYGGRLKQMRIFADTLYNTANYFQDVPGDGHFSYEVQAFNQYGIASELSEPTEPVPFGDVDPPAPVVLSVNVDQATAQLSWTTSADAVSYKLYRDGVLIQSLALTNFDDVGLRNGSYEYEVIAVDAAGNESAKSNMVIAMINEPLLAAPINLVATPNPLELTVGLAWQTTDQPDTYRIYRSLSTDSGFALLGSTEELFYTDTSVIADTVYYYYVAAVDEYGNESMSSNVANAQIIDQIAPLPPAITSPVDSSDTYHSAQRYVDIAGTAEPGAEIYLMHQGQFLADYVIASAAPQSSQLVYNGTGEFEQFKVLPNGRVFALWNDFDLSQRHLLEYIDGSWQALIGAGNFVVDYIESLTIVDGENLLIQNFAGDAYILDTFSGESTVVDFNSDEVQIASIIGYSSRHRLMIASARVNSGVEALYKFGLGGEPPELLPDAYQYRLSPDGRYFLYTEFESSSTVPVYLLDLVTKQARTIPVADTEVDLLFSLDQVWADDSSQLMMSNYSPVSGDQQLVIYQLDSESIFTISNADGAINNATFFASEKVIYTAFDRYNSPVFIQVDIASGQQRLLSTITTPPGEAASLLAMTDRGIIYSFSRDDNKHYRTEPAGRFEFTDVVLEDGENYFAVVAVDEARNVSDASNTITVVFQQTPLPDYHLETTINPQFPLVDKDANIKVRILNSGAKIGRAHV